MGSSTRWQLQLQVQMQDNDQAEKTAAAELFEGLVVNDCAVHFQREADQRIQGIAGSKKKDEEAAFDALTSTESVTYQTHRGVHICEALLWGSSWTNGKAGNQQQLNTCKRGFKQCD